MWSEQEEMARRKEQQLRHVQTAMWLAGLAGGLAIGGWLGLAFFVVCWGLSMD